MSEKQKNITEVIDNTAKQIGYALMASMATIGMLDVPSHLNSRAVLPGQPAFAFVRNSIEDEQGNSIRRERDEIEPHYVSYSEVQRTASRMGKAID